MGSLSSSAPTRQGLPRNRDSSPGVRTVPRSGPVDTKNDRRRTEYVDRGRWGKGSRRRREGPDTRDRRCEVRCNQGPVKEHLWSKSLGQLLSRVERTKGGATETS